MEHLKSKLVKERSDLVHKITNLEKFTESDSYLELGNSHKLAIMNQLDSMREYAYTLGKRIDMADPKPKEPVVRWLWAYKSKSIEGWGQHFAFLTEDEAEKFFSKNLKTKYRKLDYSRQEFDE